jgi:hypothetical protein
MKTLLTALTATLLLASCATAPSGTAGGPVIPYPLKDCMVSDNELGSMGPVITRVHAGQEVKFCCKPCVKKFDDDPAAYLSKLPK